MDRIDCVQLVSNMKYQLSNDQKNKLISLFGLENTPRKSEHLFLNIEGNMEESFLPPKGSRKVEALNKAQLLTDISVTSEKLHKLLTRLDESFIRKINCDLGVKLDVELVSEKPGDFVIVGGEPDKFWRDISALKAVQVIQEKSAHLSEETVKHYGGGYMKQALEALFMSWPLQIPSTLSVNSPYIRYLAIILEEDSEEDIHEKLYKQVIRSDWYKGRTRNSQ